MAIDLSPTPLKWTDIKILTRKEWSGNNKSGDGWQEIKLLPPGQKLGGMELLNCSRALLPQIGRATLRFQFGQFGDDIIGASATTQARRTGGASKWDAS